MTRRLRLLHRWERYQLDTQRTLLHHLGVQRQNIMVDRRLLEKRLEQESVTFADHMALMGQNSFDLYRKRMLEEIEKKTKDISLLDARISQTRTALEKHFAASKRYEILEKKIQDVLLEEENRQEQNEIDSMGLRQHTLAHKPGHPHQG